jgi:branched-chain amino acid transport system substrate-binding protein
MKNQDPNEGWRGFSRRSFLQGAAAFGVGGGLLAACGGDDDDTGAASTDAPSGTDAPTTDAPTTDAPSGTEAPDTTTAPSGAGDLSIKIGYVTPRTGPLAPFGEADAFVLAAMRAALGDGVEIVDMDAESNPAKAGEVTQELINEGVHLILAGGTPDISVPVASACDLGEVPCITTVAPWQPHYLGTGGQLGPDVTPGVASNYNFHFFWGLEDVIANFIELWEQSGVDKVVGGMWPNDPDGNAWGDPAVGFPPALEAAGFTVVDAGRFELETQDYSAIISQFKDAGVQIVSGVVPPPVFANFQAQSLQQDFNPPVVTMAKALLFPSAVETYPQGEGLSSEIWWTDRHPFSSSITGQSAGDLAAAFESETGGQWTQPLGFAHALFEVAVDAATRAGSTDADALIGALETTTLDTVVGPVDFSAGPVPRISKTPLVAGQWVAGTDYPLELAINVNSGLPELPVDGEITLIG